VHFDASIEVVVVDLAGQPLPHATVTLRALPNSSSSSSSSSSRGRAEQGQMYALGASPRRCAVRVPGAFELAAQCWGHAQVTHLLRERGPLALTHAAWSADGYGRDGEAPDDDDDDDDDDDEDRTDARALAAALAAAVSVGGGSAARLARAQQVLTRAAEAAKRVRPFGGSGAGDGASAAGGGPADGPLVIVVRMLRFAVLFECVDVLGRSLRAADVVVPGAFSQDDAPGEGAEAPAWRLTLSEHSADPTAEPGLYEVCRRCDTQRNSLHRYAHTPPTSIGSVQRA
jgi:hypothetical protein